MSTPHANAAADFARAFVQRWARSTLNERAVAQPHFTDLCRLLEQPTPSDIDPDGEFYRFEKPLTKSGGGAGFADVWWRHRFAWEYKGPGKSLDKAYEQLQRYRGDLENPPILIACNVEEYAVHIEFTGHRSRVEPFANEDVASLKFREFMRLVFTDPEQLRPAERVESVTEQAAARLARVAQLLEARGYAPTEIAPFFMQLLFTMFAEDIKVLPGNLLSANLQESIFHPEEFPDRMRALFRSMRDGGFFGISRVPRFNGGLFERDAILPLTADEIQFLYEAAKLDWKDIEPAIFGTLFERFLDPAKRAQLGAHYTSRDDILLIVDPVVMAPLRREWASVRAQLDVLAPQFREARGGTRQRLQHRMEGMILEFIEQLGKLRILDPAAGSGNFLYVTLKQLKDLELEVVNYAAGLELQPPDLVVHPSQFHGIEKNLFAAELAQVVVWIGYLQWKRTNGFWDLQEPILEHLHSIRCEDAILGVDVHGAPVPPAWPEADIIIGNPPFLGGNKIRQGLGDGYVDALFALYEGRVPAFADLVCYWFERTRELIDQGKVKRAGLIATQGIRGGASRKVLERIKKTGNIFWAQSDRDWVLDGAVVHVSMAGFDGGIETQYILDDASVLEIHSDLSSTVNTASAKRLIENAGLCFMGASPKGPFDIDSDVARLWLEMTNASGRANADVVRPVVSGIDIAQRSRGKWTVDFGLMSLDEAMYYEAPFAYVRHVVHPVRSKNRRPAYATKWWQYAEARPGMRRALAGLSRFIATPEVAKHRVFAWMTPQALCNQQTLVFARDDDYFFGVLHSRPHELWARATGTQLREAESGCRYTPTTTFETFPFPWLPGHELAGCPCVTAIAAAARDLVAQRDAWLNPGEVFGVDLKQRTLTNLYNKRPDWLVEAHHRLDCAVFDAYGWPYDFADGEILERLLALNLARAAGQSEVAVAAVEDEEEVAAD
jgi:hypothetical protein